MSAAVIVCRGLAGFDGSPQPVPPGSYLESYDPDARAGRGEAHWTRDLTRALRFPDGGAAWECWRKQSTALPLRPDGLPNRPLTAFTVEVRAVEEVRSGG